MTRFPAAGVLLSGLIGLTGCASAGSDPGAALADHPAALAPSGRPAPALTAAGASRSSRTITGKGYTIAAEADFQQLNRTSTNGEPQITLHHASSVPAIEAVVSVLREPNPEQGVDEQSYALELELRTVRQATELTRSSVDWPGGRKSVLVQWTEQRPGSDGATVAVRYWQLNVPAGRKLTLVVVGLAPETDFSTTGIAETMATFRVNP